MKLKSLICLIPVCCLPLYACSASVPDASSKGEGDVAASDLSNPAFHRVATNATYGCRRPHGYGLYDAAVDQTFVCWNGPGMTILGRAYDHAHGSWSEAYTIQSLSFYGKWDYHNYPNLSQTPDGRLIVAWADHCESLHIARAESAHSLSGDWESRQIAENRNAYPMIFSVSETMYVFYSVDEERAWPYRSFGYLKSEDNGDTWSEHYRAVDTEKNDPDHIDEVYAFHYYVEPANSIRDSRVQFTWLMRGGPNGHNQGARNGYFAYFLPESGTWEGADGVSLGDWIDYDEMLSHCLVVDTGPYLKGYPIDKIMSSTIENDRPIVVYNLDGGAHQAVWNGEEWEHRSISNNNAKSMRQLEDGNVRILLAPGGQPSMEVLELGATGGEWKRCFEATIPYESGATNTWSMGFIDDAKPELEVLMSQIERGQEKANYSGSWPVWAVNTQVAKDIDVEEASPINAKE